MNLEGERSIPASRETVWQALNDPAILGACIPGCEQLEKTSDNGFAATVAMKVGPIKARMDGEVTLEDIDAPNSYRINGKGKGAAGFASGDARVVLSDRDGGTHLKYTVEAKIGGKLAEVGARFIDSTAQKMSDQFFDAFVQQITTGGTVAPQTVAVSAGSTTSPNYIVIAAIVTALAFAGWLLLF